MAKGARKLDRHNSPWVLLLLLAVGALLFGSATYMRELRAVDLPGAATKEIIHVKDGMGLAQIGSLLHSRGYLRSPIAFNIYAVLKGQAGKLQSGYYEISSDMAAPQVIQILADGRHAIANLTVPEGRTLAQIAEVVQSTLHIEAGQFQAAAVSQAVEEALGAVLPSAATSAEGYLFPETYRFEIGSKPEQVVKRMLEEFRARFMERLWRPTPLARRWGTLHEIVTLASLAEKEAKVDSERGLIAGVLLNRLKKGMELQCDATVQYALPTRKARLTFDDLKIESPYNTYLHKGLPPGPICNPGLASLRAALKPTPTQYLYYVARGDGTHVFSGTYAEHNAAISRIRAARAR